MFKKSISVFVILLVLSFAAIGSVMAQDELPIAEADFLNAELLVVYCFDGLENYYAFLNAETSEDELAILVDDAGIDEESATTFLTDLEALSEELGEDVDAVTAKSYFYALVIVSCFGEEAVATLPEAQDPGYYVEYFELDEEAAAYFYYLYEETSYYISIEIYLIDMGIDPADIDYVLYIFDDEESLNAYFEENGIEIDSEALYSDLEGLEAETEDDYSEDDAYLEENDEDGDGVYDDVDEDTGDDEGDDGSEDDGSEDDGGDDDGGDE